MQGACAQFHIVKVHKQLVIYIWSVRFVVVVVVKVSCAKVAGDLLDIFVNKFWKMSEKAFNLMKTLKSNNVDDMNRKLSPLRKNRKPLMEKKRRARINDSLEALKEILLKNTVAITQGNRPTKLEKADILEMTVRYLQMLHKRNTIPTSKSSECSVTSTTSLRNSLKPKSISNVDYFDRPLRLHKNKRHIDESNKENSPMTELMRSNANKFRTSERSAFRTISSSNDSKIKSSNAHQFVNDHSDPWRPWWNHNAAAFVATFRILWSINFKWLSLILVYPKYSNMIDIFRFWFLFDYIFLWNVKKGFYICFEFNLIFWLFI